LEEVEERTKIRKRYLRAMEEERWELLPGAAYARAFLRTYAEFLALDGGPGRGVPALARLAGGGVGRGARAADGDGRAAPPPLARPCRRRPPAPAADDRGDHRRRDVRDRFVLALAGGSDEEGGEPARKTAPSGRAEGAPSTGSTPAEAAEPPSRVALRLTTTGTVWVCLVDEGGRPVVEGVTLPAGEEQGPFRARAFEVTLGNGQVEMEANGRRVPIPPLAEPLGYRVTRERTRELPPPARPTCT